MKLYFSKGACSLVVRIVINEMGIACDYEAVDLKSKQTATGNDFLTINPKGAVPTLQLDNDTVLTENSVIQQYLADTHHAQQLLPSLPNFNRYKVLEWLNYVSSELHKSFGPLFNASVPQADKDKIFIPLLKKKFTFINTHLQANTYLLGEDFTLPDAYLFVMLMWAANLKIDLSELTKLTSYFNALKKRQAIEQSLQEEGIQL